jgi:hypothetical protein
MRELFIAGVPTYRSSTQLAAYFEITETMFSRYSKWKVCASRRLLPMCGLRRVSGLWLAELAQQDVYSRPNPQQLPSLHVKQDLVQTEYEFTLAYIRRWYAIPSALHFGNDQLPWEQTTKERTFIDTEDIPAPKHGSSRGRHIGHPSSDLPSNSPALSSFILSLVFTKMQLLSYLIAVGSLIPSTLAIATCPTPTTCKGLSGTVATAIKSYAPAQTFCSSKYPVPQKTCTSVAPAVVLTSTVATSTAISTVAITTVTAQAAPFTSTFTDTTTPIVTSTQTSIITVYGFLHFNVGTPADAGLRKLQPIQARRPCVSARNPS